MHTGDILAAFMGCHHVGDDLVEMHGAVSLTSASSGAALTISSGTSEPA